MYFCIGAQNCLKTGPELNSVIQYSVMPYIQIWILEYSVAGTTSE